MNDFDNNIENIQKIKKNILSFYDNLKKIKENSLFYKSNDNNNFKFVFINYLNYLNEKIRFVHKEYKEFLLFQKKFPFHNLEFNQINASNKISKQVNSMSIFPNNDIISVHSDKSIKIYDINFNIIQDIKNAHFDAIAYVYVKDEKNFATCGIDKCIKTWIKKEINQNEFQFNLNKVINNAHNDKIRKIIYCSNGDIFSCSWDKTIKIWKEDNDQYQNIQCLMHSQHVNSILLFEKKNILISSGNDGTKLWNNNYECIIYIQDAFCGGWNSLCQIDDERFIIGGKSGLMKIISISEKKIISEINNGFICSGICVIEDYMLILVCGKSNDIKIYDMITYEEIQSIKNAHQNKIKGITLLQNDLIATYSTDKNIKIWSFK